MKELKTEIILDAPREKVWKMLTNFRDYGVWNPFIISIKGTAEKGKTIEIVMMLNGKENKFKPEIKVFEENERFEWLGSMPLGIFKGRHYFILEEAGPGKTRLIHGEKFSGLLSGLILKMIGEETHRSFIAMNEALKYRIEGV